ncbi:hypothetical protein BTO12_18940 [Vibrio splendidus]|nr:hypothetical protein BTO12_18940 [Vibrio splendidus]
MSWGSPHEYWPGNNDAYWWVKLEIALSNLAREMCFKSLIRYLSILSIDEPIPKVFTPFSLPNYVKRGPEAFLF